jgi:glycyl-tRNA synthetase
MARRTDVMDTIVSLAKRRGIVYPSSEIYGGLRASWDYGRGTTVHWVSS